jgi:hypothetical protein
MVMLGSSCSPCCDTSVPGCSLSETSGITVVFRVTVPDCCASLGVSGTSKNWVRAFQNLYESSFWGLSSPRYRYITQYLYLSPLNGTHSLSRVATEVPVFFTDSSPTPRLGSIWQSTLTPHSGCSSSVISLHIANKIQHNDIVFTVYVNYLWGARVVLDSVFDGIECGPGYFLNRDLPCPSVLSDEQYRYGTLGPFPSVFPCSLTDTGVAFFSQDGLPNSPLLRGICTDGGTSTRTGIVARFGETSMTVFDRELSPGAQWQGGTDIAGPRFREESSSRCNSVFVPGCLPAGDYEFLPDIDFVELRFNREGLPSVAWPSPQGFGRYV